MITENDKGGRHSSENISNMEDDGAAEQVVENPTQFPKVQFPTGPSHNISTYRTTNVSGIFTKEIVDKAIHGPSKILTRKWRDLDMNIHKKKLSEIKAITNNQPQP